MTEFENCERPLRVARRVDDRPFSGAEHEWPLCGDDLEAPTDSARPEADERRVAKSATVSEDTAAIRRPTVPSVQPRPVALPRNKPPQWDGDPLSSFGSAREQSQFSYPFESHGSRHLSFNCG